MQEVFELLGILPQCGEIRLFLRIYQVSIGSLAEADERAVTDDEKGFAKAQYKKLRFPWDNGAFCGYTFDGISVLLTAAVISVVWRGNILLICFEEIGFFGREKFIDRECNSVKEIAGIIICCTYAFFFGNTEII